MPEGLPPPASAAAHVHPRVVPWQHALAWYEEAMRLWKRAWWRLTVLAILTLATEFALRAGPAAVALAAEIVTPLVACGLVYACARVDRREKPSLWLALEAFRASPGAIAAVVLSSAVTLVAQLFAGWWIADVNLLQLQLDPAATDLTSYDLIGIFAISTLASLPVTFVPFHVLLERVPLRQAFAASAIAFAENALPLVVYGAGTLVLLCFGLLTPIVGLLIALPLSTAAAYAAWKDVFGIRDAPVA